jgi:hypothetical protein
MSALARVNSLHYRYSAFVRRYLCDDFALPLKLPTAFGYKPFNFGKGLPLALSVHTSNVGKSLLSCLQRVHHNTSTINKT